MSRRARIVAAYATVRILNPVTGAFQIGGYYRDAILPDEADPDSVAALVRREYAEWVDEPKAEPVKAEPDKAEPVLEKDSEKADVDAKDDGDKPKSYASKEVWLAYAVSQRGEGVSEEDALLALDGKTKADLIAEFGDE